MFVKNGMYSPKIFKKRFNCILRSDLSELQHSKNRKFLIDLGSPIVLQLVSAYQELTMKHSL